MPRTAASLSAIPLRARAGSPSSPFPTMCRTCSCPCGRPRRESRHHERQQLQAHMEREKPNPRTEGSRTIQTGRKKGIREIAADFHRIPQAVEYARRLGRQHRKEKQAQEHTKDSLRDPIYDKTLEQLDRSEPDSPVFTDELSGICLTIRHYEAFAGLRERAEIQYDRLPEEIKRSRTGKDTFCSTSGLLDAVPASCRCRN